MRCFTCLASGDPAILKARDVSTIRDAKARRAYSAAG
jgi:hypothetical protein